MATTAKRRAAEQLYEAGRFLIEEGRYDEALAALERAEDAFRKLDVRGRLFRTHLSNGISGLANTLFLKGTCLSRLGDYERAATAFESSLVNSRFEKKRALKRFCARLKPALVECYRNLIKDTERLHSLANRTPDINTEFIFPFSLDPDLIPAARLYELAPEQFESFKELYERGKEKDRALRGLSVLEGEKVMRRIRIAAWSMITVLWSAYGYIAVRAILKK